MATMNVSLPDTMKVWVERRLDQGFSNTSDYVRHLIRKDQERQDAIARVQKAIDKGDKSGPGQEFDVESFKRRMRERYVD